MKSKEYVVAIYIDRGIISLIEPDGTIGWYRQRGIQNIPKEYLDELISTGRLNDNWSMFKELPKNYYIYFEDESILGRAKPNFEYKNLK